jgi:hypothetical protein
VVDWFEPLGGSCKPSVTPLFGQNTDHSCVPAKIWAVAGSVGQGRPPGRRASASPLTVASTMAALRSLGTMLCVWVILAASMLSSGAAHAEQESSTTPRPNGLSVRSFAAFVTEASKRFGAPEHWIRPVMQVESGAKQQARSSRGTMGLMQIMPKTWTELRARYGLGADPYDPRGNIWPVLHTSMNSAIATARQGSSRPTMQDLDATNVIWRRVDRCRMRRKRMSRRSHR